MPPEKILFLATCLAATTLLHPSTTAFPLSSLPYSPNINSSSTKVVGLVNNAPAAKGISGIHLLLDNDVDSSTPKNPVILLSKPRTYKDGKSICGLLGESMHNYTDLLPFSHSYFFCTGQQNRLKQILPCPALSWK
jgi:hypothetical protein